MPTKPLPPTMEPVNVGKQPPFVPEVFVTKPPAPIQNPIGGTVSALRESTVGLYAKLYPYAYNGQGQTSLINIKWPKPV